MTNFPQLGVERVEVTRQGFWIFTLDYHLVAVSNEP